MQNRQPPKRNMRRRSYQRVADLLLIKPSRQLLLDILKLGKEVRSYINLRWLNITLAMQIRAMRSQRGWTQSQLADKAGLTVLTIVRLEKLYWGKSNPTLNTLIAIAAAFDVGLCARFCPWSELLDQISGTAYIDNGLSPATFNIPIFEEELKSGAFDSQIK